MDGAGGHRGCPSRYWYEWVRNVHVTKCLHWNQMRIVNDIVNEMLSSDTLCTQFGVNTAYICMTQKPHYNQHYQRTNGPDQVHSIALPYKIWISVYGFTMVIAYLSIIKRFNRMCCVHLHALLSFFFFVYSREFKLQIIKCLIVNERHFNSSNVANIISVEYCRFPFILAKWKKKVNCICLHCNYR